MKRNFDRPTLFTLLAMAALCCGPAVTSADTPAVEPLPVNVFKNLKAGKKQTVIAYGTSLTAGGEWTKSLQDYLDKHYPGQVTFLNAAKNGMHSNWGVANFQERVLAKKPDLVFIEFSINDANTKNAVSLEKSGANLDRMVKAVRQQNPDADVVLQTMNLAWDSPVVKGKTYGSDRKNLVTYYDVYRQYATKHGLPLVDNLPAWQKLLQDDRAAYEKKVPDGIHPDSSASVDVTWKAIETMLEKARAAADK